MSAYVSTCNIRHQLEILYRFHILICEHVHVFIYIVITLNEYMYISTCNIKQQLVRSCTNSMF